MFEAVARKIKHAWNAFNNQNEEPYYNYNSGGVYSYRPDRPRFSYGNDKNIITSVYNRIALDCAAVSIFHVNLDDEGSYIGNVSSHLNKCLTIEANIDQTGRSLMQDVVMSLLDEGCVAIVPVDTSSKPDDITSYDINTLRVGKVIEWRPKHVKINLYNELTGNKEDIILPKSMVAIIENPFYSVINEPNSTMRRLIHKLNLLDVIDEQSSSGKLDLIIQLPYSIKTETRKNQAEIRRKTIEDQLSNTKYGIAYTDGTERITQLNRPVENNLMAQIEYLTSMLYSQLGLTQSILDGTADDQTMINYNDRTIEPILSAITDEMKRKFLTKQAINEKQSIMFFRDPFKLVPVDKLAEIADKLSRNEIMSSNEVRGKIGMKPSSDPDADKLKNKNISSPKEETSVQGSDKTKNVKEKNQNESI